MHQPCINRYSEIKLKTSSFSISQEETFLAPKEIFKMGAWDTAAGVNLLAELPSVIIGTTWDLLQEDTPQRCFPSLSTAARPSFCPCLSLVFFQGVLKQGHIWDSSGVGWLPPINQKTLPNPWCFLISHRTCRRSAAKTASSGSCFTNLRMLSERTSLLQHSLSESNISPAFTPKGTKFT